MCANKVLGGSYRLYVERAKGGMKVGNPSCMSVLI